MAGPLSPAARAKSLRNDFGPIPTGTRVENWIAHIYDGNPAFDGVELDDATCPGYAAPEFNNDEFTAVDGGVEALVAIADSTGPWTKTGRWVVLEDADNPGEFWDYVAVAAVRPRDEGDFDPLQITIFYSDDSTDPS